MNNNKKMRVTRGTLVSVISVGLIFPSGLTSAQSVDIEDIYEENIINDVSPYYLERENISLSSTTTEYKSELETIDVVIPVESSDNLTITDVDSDYPLEISITEDYSTGVEINDSVVYKGEDSAVGVEVFEGGVRHSYVLENEDSDNEFTINYSSEDFSHMDFSYSEIDGTTDGSVLIYDNTGDTIAAIDSPWAIDADGKDIKTYYKIDDNKLIQVVETDNDTVYPVIADPTTWKTYFSSISWIERGGSHGRSLSLTPTKKLRISGAFRYTGPFNYIVSNAIAKDSWNKVSNKYKKHTYWKNTAGMKKQYLCHFRYAFGKDRFNLEPSRPNVSQTATNSAWCNPK